PAASAPRALPLLPVRPAHRTPRWLRRGGSRLLWRPTRVDRTPAQRTWDDLWVRLLDPRTGQLQREHLRQKRGRYRIKQEDYPKRVPLGTSQLLARARRAGTEIGTLCQQIHHQQGELGVRRILGVLALAKKFGLAALEDACTV